MGEAAPTVVQRFAPLNSWPDQAEVCPCHFLGQPDDPRRYGSDGLHGHFETLGFAGGRIDAWEPEEVNWGSEGEWLSAARTNAMADLERPFGATQMGLIYVNPEGPGGNPDPQGRPITSA